MFLKQRGSSPVVTFMLLQKQGERRNSVFLNTKKSHSLCFFHGAISQTLFAFPTCEYFPTSDALSINLDSG